MEKAKSASDAKEADANFLKAWRLYYFGQWPAPTSPGKLAAYRKAVDAYLLHAKTFDPPLEVVRIPFEDSEIVAYLRLPAGVARPVPLVLAISGLDSRKETVSETYAAAVAQGIGFIAVDSPGTGQAPVKAGETADKIYSRVLDYLATRPEIDKSRIVVHGQSFAPAGRQAALRELRGLPVPWCSRRRSTKPFRPIFIASGCTRANICSTCSRRACSCMAEIERRAHGLPSRRCRSSLRAARQAGAPIFVVGERATRRSRSRTLTCYQQRKRAA